MTSHTSRLPLLLLPLAGLVLLLAPACATPTTQTLVEADFVGDKTVKYMLLEPGRTRAEAVVDATAETTVKQFHFSIRVCDIGSHGEETNCKDSIVLERVGLNPDPQSTALVDADRQVTNLFWYDPQTLYVSYMERRRATEFFDRDYIWEPWVQMCRVLDNNGLYCDYQDGINHLLVITTE